MTSKTGKTMELDGKLLLSFIILLLLAVCLRFGWQPYSELVIGDFNDFKLEGTLFFGTLFVQLYLANKNEANPFDILTFQIEGRVFFHITCLLLPFILTTLGYLAKLHYIIHYGEDVKPAIMQVTGKEYRPRVGRYTSSEYITYFKPFSDYAPYLSATRHQNRNLISIVQSGAKFRYYSEGGDEISKVTIFHVQTRLRFNNKGYLTSQKFYDDMPVGALVSFRAKYIKGIGFVVMEDDVNLVKYK